MIQEEAIEETPEIEIEEEAPEIDESLPADVDNAAMAQDDEIIQFFSNLAEEMDETV